MLALPAVPLAMLLGCLSGFAGYISVTLGQIVSLPAYALLQWIILVATFSSALPLSSLTVPALPAWLVAAVYVPLTWFAVRKYQEIKK
jgi:hypothetical protein